MSNKEIVNEALIQEIVAEVENEQGVSGIAGDTMYFDFILEVVKKISQKMGMHETKILSDHLTSSKTNPITPKFRVWNNISAKMWAVDELIWDDSGRCQPVGGQSSQSFLVYSDKDILMQWTGLLDDSGVEIFEGDIVRFIPYGAIEKVIYDAPCFKTNVRGLRGYDCKVIGNVFENSNLLEEKIV